MLPSNLDTPRGATKRGEAPGGSEPGASLLAIYGQWQSGLRNTGRLAGTAALCRCIAVGGQPAVGRAARGLAIQFLEFIVDLENDDHNLGADAKHDQIKYDAEETEESNADSGLETACDHGGESAADVSQQCQGGAEVKEDFDQRMGDE